MNRFLKQIRIALAGVSVMVVSAACFAGTTIDLLVAYDRTAADYVAASGQTVESFAAQEIARMNEVVRNSKLDSYFTFRLVGVCSVGAAVADEGSSEAGFQNALHKLKAGTGAWKTANAARETYGADIVVTLTDTGSTSGIQGLGYALERGDDIVRSAPYAYCVCAIRSLDTSYTMVHEVGHIMGAGHPDSNPSTLKFDPGPQYDAAAAGFYVGDKVTVMGYRTADYAVIPYFSSPELAFEGATLGDAKHNNRQTLISTYKAISEYRKSPFGPIDPIDDGGVFDPQKADVWPGFAGSADAPTYVLQAKIGKASKKNESKVSVTVIGLDGKKYTSKAVKVPTGGNPTVDFEVKKLGKLMLTFGANGFSGSLNGAPVVSGGNSVVTTDGKATFAAGNLSSLAGVLTKYLLADELVTRTDKKWTVKAKAGKLKYNKKANPKRDIVEGLQPTGSNIAGLKLTYTPKTQTFKGSFKVWTFDAAKKKLKSVSAKVTGVVVDGVGYGQVTVKKDVIGELTVR